MSGHQPTFALCRHSDALLLDIHCLFGDGPLNHVKRAATAKTRVWPLSIDRSLQPADALQLLNDVVY